VLGLPSGRDYRRGKIYVQSAQKLIRRRKVAARDGGLIGQRSPNRRIELAFMDGLSGFAINGLDG